MTAKGIFELRYSLAQSVCTDTGGVRDLLRPAACLLHCVRFCACAHLSHPCPQTINMHSDTRLYLVQPKYACVKGIMLLRGL
jgi:hypothetical protein